MAILTLIHINDWSILWSGSLDSVNFWITQLQELLFHNYNLEITYEVSDPYCSSVFLDVEYYFDPVQNRFVTNIYHKPTDAHNYLPYNSCHPRHIFRSIVYSQAIRYRRIISDDNVLEIQLSNLLGYFTNCGYPEPMVREIIEHVKVKPRILEYIVKSDDKPFHVPMLTQFGVGSEELKYFVNNDINNNLMSAPIFASLEKPVIKTVFYTS